MRAAAPAGGRRTHAPTVVSLSEARDSAAVSARSLVTPVASAGGSLVSPSITGAR